MMYPSSPHVMFIDAGQRDQQTLGKTFEKLFILYYLYNINIRK